MDAWHRSQAIGASVPSVCCVVASECKALSFLCYQWVSSHDVCHAVYTNCTTTDIMYCHRHRYVSGLFGAAGLIADDPADYVAIEVHCTHWAHAPIGALYTTYNFLLARSTGVALVESGKKSCIGLLLLLAL